MSEILNPALAGEIGSETRQRMDNVEYRVSILWLADEPDVPFQPDPGPPPLVFGTSGMWVLTLSQADGTTLVAGQALRSGVNVLAGFAGNPLFPGQGFGQLLAFDLTGNGRNPGRDDLDPGSDVRLVYRTAAEVTA